MRRTITALYLALIPVIAFTQTDRTCGLKTIYNCGTNLANEQFSDVQIQVIHGISYAKPAPTAPDVNYYSKNNSNLDDCGFPGPDCSYDGSALTYDVYFPNAAAYPCYRLQPLPAIFLFPGGGFSDCVDESDGTSEYCMAFAKRGFVAFNVNYRRGRLKNPSGKDITASQLLAIYRACQDARGAIKSAILNNFFNTQFRFDTANIFIGGVSAGGQIALQTAYVSTEEMNEAVFKNVSLALGPINANFYAAPARASFTIKGVLNLWGALYTAPGISVSNFLQRNANNPPLIAFHGLKDNVFDPNEITALLSGKYPFNTDSTCILNKGYAYPDGFRTLRHCGSLGLYNELTQQLAFPLHCEVYLDSDMGHGLDQKSDFGFGDGKISKDSLEVYIVQRAATFFQTIVKNTTKFLQASEFTDCVNYRVQSCNALELQDNNACSLLAFQESKNNNNTAAKKFKLFQQQKNIKLLFENNSKRSITIYDMYGRVIHTVTSSANEVYFNCSSCVSGIYNIVVNNGNTVEKAGFSL